VKLERIKKLSLKTYAIALIIAFFVGLVLGGAIVYSQSSNENITIVSGSFTETASYVIFKVGDTIYAKNGTTGEIEYSGTDASQVINNAISSASSSGGGVIFLKAGIYTISSPIIMKENVRLCGETDSKIAQPAVQIKASATFSGNAMVITEYTYVSDDNSPVALTQSPELFDLSLNGENNVEVGVNFTNVDTARFERVRISGVSTCIAIEYYGELPIPASGSTYNGFFIEKCILLATNTSIYAEYATQSWIVNCWFVSGANRHIDLLCCNKIRIIGNELNPFKICGIHLADTTNDKTSDIIISENWLYTSYDAKYFSFDLGNNANTKRIKIDDNILCYTAATRPNKTDFPDGIPQSSFSNNIGVNSYSEQWGNATISAGSSSVTVYHNLLRAPHGVVVTSSNATSTGDVWATNFADGSFVIQCENTVSEDTVVYWFAWTYP